MRLVLLMCKYLFTANTTVEYQRTSEGCRVLAMLPEIKPLQGGSNSMMRLVLASRMHDIVRGYINIF